MKLLQDYILIKKKTDEEIKNGIIVPEEFIKENTQFSEGVVIALGDSVKNTDLVIGSNILFKSFTSLDFNIKDEKLIKEEDIVAIL